MRTKLLSNSLTEQESKTLLQNAETYEPKVAELLLRFSVVIKNLDGNINLLTGVQYDLIKETLRSLEEDYSTCQTFATLFAYVKEKDPETIPKNVCPTKFLDVCLNEEHFQKVLSEYNDELSRADKINFDERAERK